MHIIPSERSRSLSESGTSFSSQSHGIPPHTQTEQGTPDPLVPETRPKLDLSQGSAGQTYNNNNNRELREHFWKLKVLYNLMKNIHCANTQYKSMVYKYTKDMKINIFIQSMAKHTHTKSHTHI